MCVFKLIFGYNKIWKKKVLYRQLKNIFILCCFKRTLRCAWKHLFINLYWYMQTMRKLTWVNEQNIYILYFYFFFFSNQKLFLIINYINILFLFSSLFWNSYAAAARATPMCRYKIQYICNNSETLL